MSLSPIWVVKLGGSLFAGQYLRPWLDVLATHGRGCLVIVPGGGPFADEVRAAQKRWCFDDAMAHRMAMLGMAQYGLMLAALQSELTPAVDEAEIGSALRAHKVPVCNLRFPGRGIGSEAARQALGISEVDKACRRADQRA
jgi:5-(aminomethyl)-3-furanmethanol phosphate kinase